MLLAALTAAALHLVTLAPASAESSVSTPAHVRTYGPAHLRTRAPAHMRTRAPAHMRTC